MEKTFEQYIEHLFLENDDLRDLSYKHGCTTAVEYACCASASYLGLIQPFKAMDLTIYLACVGLKYLEDKEFLENDTKESQQSIFILSRELAAKEKIANKHRVTTKSKGKITAAQSKVEELKLKIDKEQKRINDNNRAIGKMYDKCEFLKDACDEFLNWKKAEITFEESDLYSEVNDSIQSKFNQLFGKHIKEFVSKLQKDIKTKEPQKDTKMTAAQIKQQNKDKRRLRLSKGSKTF